MVDWDFISEQEGGQYTEGYIPEDEEGNVLGESGVTVATGVDLGQRDREELENMGLSEELLDQLDPYLELREEKAQEYLEEHPLTLSEEDADALDEAVHGEIQQLLEENYDEDSNVDFSDLPEEAQTVISDVATQYGPNLEERTPNFWDAVTNQDWDSAYNELRDFEDDYASRRNREADLIQPITSYGEDNNGGNGNDNNNGGGSDNGDGGSSPPDGGSGGGSGGSGSGSGG